MPNVTVKESQHDSIELGITISKTDFKISKFVIQYKIDNEVWDDARKEEFEYGMYMT